MNIKFLTPVILLGALSVSAWAQATQRPNTSAPASNAPAQPVPTSKIAVLDLVALRGEIGELKQRYEKLNAEFGPKMNEVQSLQSSLEAIEKTDTSKYTPQQLASLKDKYDSTKKDLDRKKEDYQGLADRRAKEETEPIYDKISKFLEQYAVKNGLTIVFEINAARESQVIVYLAQATNITEDFVKEYNKAYPVAAAPPPGPKK